MEIGSVIELDSWEKYKVPQQKKSFWLPFMKENDRYRSVFYQSGRNAIEGLLLFLKEGREVNKLLLPDYMCETVKDAGKRAGVSLEYYKINREYTFDVKEIDEKLTKDTCLFVAHFFGKKQEKEAVAYIKRWKEQGIIVIEDVTLSMFSSDEEMGVGFGTYTLGSIRKWLPVPDGGFVASATDELPEECHGTCVSKYADFYFMVQAMKREYLQGGCRDKNLKKIYMDYYGLSINELFSDYQLYPMTDWTRNYLQNYDLAEVVRKRKANYDYLFDKLSGLEGFKRKVCRQEGYLPLGMVIEIEERDQLLQYLIRQDIYCNVHWRLEASETNPDVTYLAQHTITIPCDQRYGFEEMDYIVDAMERWVKG